MLKFFSTCFFCKITKYDCAKFNVKNIFLLGYMQAGGLKGHYVSRLPSRDMIRQNYSGADRVNKTKTSRSLPANTYLHKVNSKNAKKRCVKI